MIRYLKAFVIVGVIATLVIFTLQHQFVDLSGALSNGFLASLAFVFFIFVSNRIVTREMRREGYDEIPLQKRSLVVTAEFEKVQLAADRALDLLEAKIIREKSSDYRIYARAGFSWKSHGEKIEVIFSNLSINEWEIIVISRPIVPGTMFDYGKGFENVTLLINEMSKYLKHSEDVPTD